LVKVVLEADIKSSISVRGESHPGFSNNVLRLPVLVSYSIFDLGVVS
jgi:hypothetical protein